MNRVYILMSLLGLGAYYPAYAMKQELSCPTALERLSDQQKTIMTGAMGTINAFIGTPFQHIKNSLQNNESLPPAKHLWRGTGLNIVRSTPSTLPEVMIIGNADRIIKTIQLPLDCDTQKAALAFASAAPGTIINTATEQIIMRRKNGSSSYAVSTDILKSIGAAGLLRGFTPKFMRDGIGSLAYWHAAPKLKQIYKNSGASEVMATIAAGLSVALPATFITHPFDTISTAMQNDLQKKNYRNMLQSIRAYTQINGYKSLFKGLVPRATSAAARVPALIYVQENLTHHFNKNYKN